MCQAWWAGHLIDELTTGQEQFHGFYFALHFDTSSGQRFSLAVCMHNTDMVIASNARAQDSSWALLIIVTQAYLQVPGHEQFGGLPPPPSSAALVFNWCLANCTWLLMLLLLRLNSLRVQNRLVVCGLNLSCLFLLVQNLSSKQTDSVWPKSDDTK